MLPDEYEIAIAADVAWQLCNGNKTAAEGILFVWSREVETKKTHWFSVVNTARNGVFSQPPDPRSPEFQQVLQVADLIYHKQRVDRLTHGATMFTGPGAQPEGYALTTSIGSTFFWKEA